MKILVDRMLGDATVLIYNKQGDLIHTEGFFGKTVTGYVRDIPVAEVEYGSSRVVFTGEFTYKVVA